MKGYGTDYKPLGKNNSVAYFETDVESLIANEGKTGTPLPNKIQYTLPNDNLVAYAPIDGEIQYLKLEVEDKAGTILYFYRNDMSQVMAVDKENNFHMAGTFTMDYYYTYFRDMFTVLKDANPEVYFLRRFADRLADFKNPRLNFNEQFGYRNQLPIQIQGSYTEQLAITNQDIMDRNDISNFIANPLEQTEVASIELRNLKKGSQYKYVKFSDDFMFTTTSSQFVIQINNGGTDLARITLAKYKSSPYSQFTNDVMTAQYFDGNTVHDVKIMKDNIGSTQGYSSDSNTGLTGNLSQKTLTFPILETVDAFTGGTVGTGTNYNGSCLFYTELPQNNSSISLSFADQSIGNKFRYAVVNKDLINSSISPGFTKYCQNNAVDIFLIPLPVRDFTYTDANGSSVNVPISSYNSLLYNYQKDPNELCTGAEGTVLQTFEMPICFDVLAGDTAAGIYMDHTNNAIPLILKPLYSSNILFQNYFNLINLNPINISNYSTWTTNSEPYLEYSPQFTRYYFGLDNSLVLPATEFEYTNNYVPISFYMTINDKATLKLDTRELAPGSKIAQDVSLYQMVVSNNTARATSAYNNGLQNNMTTEQTARANLADEKKMMDRNIGWGGAKTAMNSIGDLVGAGAGFATGDIGAGLGGLTGVAQNLGDQAISTQNQQTQFGIKQRNLESQFANIRKAPESINNSAVDNQNIPLTTDGLLMQREGLTPAQENAVMQELYNYGYIYNAVDNLVNYSNRVLYNVIQINTEYNREQLEQIIKTNYSGVGNGQSAINAFLDWMGSIHRFYNNDTFKVEQSGNIEISNERPPSITYSIDPIVASNPDNIVNGVATMQYQYATVTITHKRKGSVKLTNDLKSFSVDFTQWKWGTNHAFDVDGTYTPPISKELYQVVTSDRVESIKFTNNFAAVYSSSSGHRLSFSDGKYISLFQAYNTGQYICAYDTPRLNIGTDGTGANSTITAEGIVGDKDTLTLTFPTAKTANSNQILQTDYSGSATAETY